MNRALTKEDIELCQNVEKLPISELQKYIRVIIEEFDIFTELNDFYGNWVTSFGPPCESQVPRINPLTPVGVRCNSRIVCSACKPKNSDIIICSPRHLDGTCRAILKSIAVDEKDKFILPSGQGFVDQYGTWFNREEAYIIAKANNQIIRRCGGDEGTLYSENLY
jgi:hypothetical protein